MLRWKDGNIVDDNGDDCFVGIGNCGSSSDFCGQDSNDYGAGCVRTGDDCRGGKDNYISGDGWNGLSVVVMVICVQMVMTTIIAIHDGTDDEMDNDGTDDGKDNAGTDD